MNPTDLTAVEIREQIARGSLSSRDVTRAFVERTDRLEPRVRAFLSRTSEEALARAKELDELQARGESAGKLHGVPLAVKDIISVKGTPCTCGSRILENYVPPYDATAVERLLAEGAVLVGKCNLDEFAMGSSTENSAFHPTHNPWDLGRVPGGSSGGSAAAVAAREVPAALGTDTGGSVRQPAALCGVTGLKPTYGRVSRYGLVAFASSLDQIGPLTRSVEDAALLLGVTAGHDPLDSTSAPEPTENYLQQLQQDVSKLRIGIPRELPSKGLDPDVLGRYRAAIATLEEMGVEAVEIDLATSSNAVACYYLISTSEASSNLARYDGVRYGLRVGDAQNLQQMYRQTREEGFGAEVKRRIMLGTYVLSAGYYDAYYVKAQKVRTLIARDFQQAFEQVDAVALPTTPTPAFELGEKLEDPLQMYLSDVFTITANLVGIPGISVPAGFSGDGLPIGLQLLGKHFAETTVLRLAYAFEQATDFAQKRPPLD
ncbi:MAG: Asp-tRNA(Asn)/Glu-tRNA(Gln) amidotransferase subunit GatA [Vicinamibacteria bacterium]